MKQLKTTDSSLNDENSMEEESKKTFTRKYGDHKAILGSVLRKPVKSVYTRLAVSQEYQQEYLRWFLS